ncbi:3-phosphoshikimate 1-carboxyvinyltransferase [Verrucosispora sp. WMMD703]|uniref:3-phosphoshikimate 1-carboxyvinyltransferase n=1 Tax=Micromonospora sediminimaris TaxID=547162 RepID=A0A9W5XKR8_9ACTN|nr:MULTISPECIES: 3-phosphoshikimate 1-carboxyvinyltransferase [Micromonospora]WFE46600.1 3-phosphoshikimate 1-carboxyvinyltransferase [Verrucosispora sp. WMMD1129]GIJ34262.1 3-phosphoshikimate 1-carboxyvinyltransferase 1 [Micromonospora sediminimaris]SFC97968.1 3-phosphoshikimate 1-carboxyvinyltransferase [Micromonospora sediminimaris]
MGNVTATRPLQPWTAPTASDPVSASLRLPGSKSMTNRALVLSALAAGPSTLSLPLRARDTELMAAALRAMGAHVSIADDDRWLVRPHRLFGPAQVDVGLAGTIMRFVPPVAGLADGQVTLDGDPSARTRPLGPLIEALRSLGVRVDTPASGSLPLVVLGTGRVTGGEVVIDASASSQLVSGLLLAAPRFDRGLVVRHVGPPVPSAPHLRMTVQMLRAAGAAVDDSTPDVWAVEPGPLTGRSWEIEPDLSGAVPFFAAALVTGGEVTLRGWPARGSAQPVERLRSLLQQMGAEVALTTEGLTVRGTGPVKGLHANLSDVSELTPALTALAMLADSPSVFTGVSHIRGHETDRLAALNREFTGLGADITESADGLEIRPRPLHGGVFRTYHDHRMAHAAAVAGLVVPGVELDDVSCTSKTMPEFPALWSALVTGKS